MAKKDTLIKLKEKERELRQTLIIEAARKVFGQKTYDRVSMAEIAKTAGIAKSSIYTYFKSQEELYAKIAFQDACVFIVELENRIHQEDKNVVKKAIDYFLDYYITNEPQWRMITHFALHGNKDMKSVGLLNEIGRKLMDVFEIVFTRSGLKSDTRLMAHTLFSCLSGVLIAFRKYPGRSEEDRIAHMKKIGSMIESMIIAFIKL
ncbi:MAG: TetR/AcrR family transcriptional regulator [Desulfobacteraceae bacterium]|nr:TetR/AcrR family transcriptional regulator [Desulfobacteraceae bacterium]